MLISVVNYFFVFIDKASFNSLFKHNILIQYSTIILKMMINLMNHIVVDVVYSVMLMLYCNLNKEINEYFAYFNLSQ